MKKVLVRTSLVVAVGALAGCVSGPSYEGPRPGDTCYVSTECLDVHSAPDGLSSVVTRKKYGESVGIEAVYRAELEFNGDRNVFPESLIPCWLAVGGGYVPASSLASEWLIKNQDPTKRISNEGMIAAKRGFSEEEGGDMSSMRGAAGSGTFLAAADYGKLETVYSGQRKCRVELSDIKKFVQEGCLAGHEVPGAKLDVSARGTSSKIGGGLASGLSSGLSMAADAVGKGDDTGLVSAVGKTTAGLIWNECGPVQEFQLGESVAAKVLPAYEMAPMTDPRSQYVSKIATALSAASNAPMPYRGLMVVLVDSKEINAFAIPGGFLIVTTGMLEFLKDEDELAAIIGHEIGHLELGHGTKAVGTEKVLKLFSLLKEVGASGVRSDNEATKLLIAKLKQMIDEVFERMYTSIRNGYSVELESQADWRSLQLCHRLGYDTKSLYDVLERFKSVKGTYGGAGYPAQRGADILKYRGQFGIPDETAKGRGKRASRYHSSTAR